MLRTGANSCWEAVLRYLIMHGRQMPPLLSLRGNLKRGGFGAPVVFAATRHTNHAASTNMRTMRQVVIQ